MSNFTGVQKRKKCSVFVHDTLMAIDAAEQLLILAKSLRYSYFHLSNAC